MQQKMQKKPGHRSLNADRHQRFKIRLSTKERVFYLYNPGRYALRFEARFVGHCRSLETLSLLRLRTGPKEWLDSNRVNMAAEVKSLLAS
jgi:hypothetical protein